MSDGATEPIDLPAVGKRDRQGEYITLTSIGKCVAEHVRSLRPAHDADGAGGGAEQDEITGAQMSRFVQLFVPSSANANDTLSPADVERLLRAAYFQPEERIRIAVSLLTTKKMPSQRNTEKVAPRGSRGEKLEGSAKPSGITVTELTWLLTQNQQEGADVAGKAKKRRAEVNTADHAAFVAGTPLIANLRRQFVDLTDADRELGRVPMSAHEFSSLQQTLQEPLGMTLRLHNADPTLRAIACALAGQQGHAGGLRSLPIFAGCPAVQALAMSNADYHDAANRATELLCRNGHSAGLWSFQEAVSMLPVAALGVEGHHRVLDMCSAPGSKTLQALDAMLTQGQAAANGAIVANEKDRVKARQTLPSRLKRHHSFNAIVTRGDATSIPAMVRASANGGDAEQLRFDRIICDVPCSGDGTVRKDAGVWAGWSNEYADSLVKTQRALLLRAIDLLAEGGIVAYSTCSMNVAEDEEVVARCLDCYGDDVELLDVNARLRDAGVVLHSAGGLATPTQPSKRSEEPDADAPARRAAVHRTIRDKVLRVLPHNDDTGGFFVALIRRVRPHPAVPATKLNNWTNAKRFVRVYASAEDTAVFSSILAHFGIDDAAFKSATGGAEPVWMVTPTGDKKKLLLLSRGASDLVFNCQLRKGPGLELVSCGARAFDKLDTRYLPAATGRFRMAGEVVSLLGPLCTRRVATLTDLETIQQFLRNGFMSAEGIKLAGGTAGASTHEVGPIVLRLQPPRSSGLAEGTWLWVTGVLTGAKVDLTVDQNVVRTLAKYVFGVELAEVAGQRGGSDDDEAATGEADE
jgi:16S rRNA C967 or C1407 C5-methylase (RsmB/RsmF family)